MDKTDYVEDQRCGTCVWFNERTGKCTQDGKDRTADDGCRYWLYWDVYDGEVREP